MRQRMLALLVPALVLAGTGCATKDYVREVVGQSQAQTDTRIGEQTKRIDEQAARVEEQATRVDKQLGEVGGRVTKLETSVDEFGNIARTAATKADEAMARADAVGTRVSRALGARYKRKLVETIHVQFGLDRADLTDAAQTALAELIKELAENPALTVDLEGYTDSTGSVQHNLQLADRRAEGVRRFLVAHGVDLSRINWIGMGELKGPERAKNRRVTVRLMLSGDEPGMSESRGGGEEKAGAAGAEKKSEAPADTAVAGDKAMRDGDTATATHEKPDEAPAATEKESQ
jgi:outer membrane protein OmpA-like peptidoglycan-associated protein